jgi:hypothetical protein
MKTKFPVVTVFMHDGSAQILTYRTKKSAATMAEHFRKDRRVRLVEID